MVPAPVTVPAVESAATEKPEPRSVVAIARPDEDAEANRWNVYDRARRRWRRVIVSSRGSAVRLNHICAGVRAQNSSKAECQHGHCYDEKFLSHDVFLLLSGRLNPATIAKLPKKMAPAF
jgi:hypothetical protein